jgi:hypothetical protein
MSLPPVESIPRSLSEVHGWKSWWLWAVFGNDRDGVTGGKIRAGVQHDDEDKPARDGGLFWFGQDQPYDQEHFERWWKRNPANNLTLYVLARPVRNPVYIIGKTEPKPWHIPGEGDVLPYMDEKYKPVVLRFNPFFIKLGYFFVGWVAFKPMPDGGAFNIGFKSLS